MALLNATHALSDYRIVLKQGEPFTPVLLRVHHDPISIIGKILEQNPKSYTRINDLLDLGTNMVSAGLTAKCVPQVPEETAQQAAVRRITAMCIDASLTEDDFETAYSYITNRLSSLPPSTPTTPDDYSWKAALQAGKYRLTPRTLPPTHLGTASANPAIRHLEQRTDCLSVALRIAPAPTLTDILNAFRRCEEELVAALAAEAAMEAAWDEKGDYGVGVVTMPGAFGSNPTAVRKPGGGAKARRGSSVQQQQQQQGEEKPMSLFDLSRASVASAQRNLTALSSLQRSGLGRLTGSVGSVGGVSQTSAGSDDEDGHAKRVRKRDQLREAAMGTLVSGVGWLIGADQGGVKE